MTESHPTSPSARGLGRKPWRRRVCLALVFVMPSGGCSTPRDVEAVRAYYRGDFGEARDRWREGAFGPVDENTILHQARLGMASLADGDLEEAERALGSAFEWLSTAGLNADRTTAAVLLHEDVRIWKGEPFEQALIYSEVAALYAELGDWENVRAASANALFRLTDFGADQSLESIATKASEDDDYLRTGYTAVDTNFALGFLLQATGSRLSNASGAQAQFDSALAIDESLEPVVAALRDDFDTLFIVDWGKGPTKQAYGPDEALSRFVPQDESDSWIVVDTAVDDEWRAFASYPAVCDVNALARDHRWANLEDARRVKSLIGRGLMIGGFATAAASGQSEHQILGLGLALLGGLLRAGSAADVRYLETAPQLVYLVPLRLGGTTTLRLQLDESEWILDDFEPGTPRAPRAIYARMLRP